MEETIQKAIEGGYPKTKKEGTQYFIHYGEKQGNRLVWHCTPIEKILLNPLFWQALGRSMGWKNPTQEEAENYGTRVNWHNHWVAFIDHLAEGKDTESFFKDLLANPTLK